MLFYYSGRNGVPHVLRESVDKFIIRTNARYNPVELFAHTTIAAFRHRITLVDYYPEASVYVYRLTNAKPGERDLLKNKLNEISNANIVFIGTIMEREDSGVYQIYTGNIFLKFKNHISENEQNKLIAAFGLHVKLKLKFTQNAYFCDRHTEINREIFDFCLKILECNEVELCHPELVVHRKTFYHTNNAPATKSNNDWIKSMINLEEGWRITKGKGITICIIDDGIDLSHPSLKKFTGKIISKDILIADADGSHKDDTEMHGTACAGIACSNDPTATGVAPEANLMVIRSKGLGSVLEAEAIYWAVKNGADIISCSWGPADRNILDPQSNFYNHPLPDHTRLAFEFAVKKGRNGLGCLIFFAAGNGKEPVEYDGYASNEFVMAVGAVNKYGQLTQYSDYGKSLFCCFPSSEIQIENNTINTLYGLTTLDRAGKTGYAEADYYEHFGGTSASCPGMAGVAALMLSINPGLSLLQCKNLIKEACYYPASQKKLFYKDKLGNGIIDAMELLLRAQQTNTTIKPKTIMAQPQANKKIAVHVAVDILDRSVYVGSFSNLNGCVNDLNLFKALTALNGYEQHFFINETATRSAVMDFLKKISAETGQGDEVVFTFSGHGGSIDSKNIDEEADGKDETLVLHDGMILDDEIREILLSFGKGVNIFWYTDCCHSGTNTRNLMSVNTFRSLNSGLNTITETISYRVLPSEILNNVCANNKEVYKPAVRGTVRSNNDDNYLADIIHFAACKDDQFAAEIRGNGLFTSTIFAALAKNATLSYADLFDILARAMPNNQQPVRNIFGNPQMAFLQSPFLSSKNNVNTGKDNTNDKPSAKTDSLKLSPYSDLDTSSSLVINGAASNLEFSTSNGLRGEKNVVWAKRELNADEFSGKTIWDKAYTAYLNMNKPLNDNDTFIEPDMASAVFGDPLNEDISRSEDGYLETYPSPTAGNELWHLGNEHSQLADALFDACKEDVILGRNKNPLQEYPLIAHIDTGVLSGGPMHPLNLDFDSSQRFDDPIDKDRFLIPNFIEQQGHGNATLALLAGGKLVLPEETALQASQYFGGFPFARVVTLKISESVAILRGKSFAKALNYAVNTLKADVVTMSMAGAPSRIMLDAINNAYDKGVIVVSAAGNCWSKGIQRALPSTIMYPAIFNRVIAATGVTLDKTPYLNKFNQALRNEGGKYMQSCYGPLPAMRTTLAASTPNVLWFGKKNRPYYSKSGGGTSSATPQIAAAAALYCYKYRDILKKVNEPWMKIAIVRKALFSSADTTRNGMYGDVYEHNGKSYDLYFGNGLLKAYDALQIDAQQVLDEINEDPQKFKEKADSIGITGVDDLIRMWFRSGNTDNSTLKDMLALEIKQLLFTEPELFEFIHSENLTYEMKVKLYNTKTASEQLKDLLAKDLGLNYKRTNFRNNNLSFKTELLEFSPDTTIVVAIRNTDATIRKTNEPTDDVHLGGFSIELNPDASRNGNTPAISISNSVSNDDDIFLITEEYEDGSKYYRWSATKDDVTQRGLNNLSVYIDQGNVLHIEIPVQRGIFKKIKRFFVNIFRTLKDKAASPLQGLLYGTIKDNNVQWVEFSKANEDIKTAISQQEKTLFLSHGTFSAVEVSFKALCANANFLNTLSGKSYGKYILGYNMSTVKSGVNENAEDILNALRKNKIDKKTLVIIGASRGCLVARKAFPGQKMILSAGPHFGTPIADERNVSRLINRITGLAITIGGVTSPLIAVLAFAAKGAIKLFWRMDGLTDMAPGSSFLQKLNTQYPISAEQELYLVGMNYNASGLKSVIDITLDNQIFADKPNDMVVPFWGAINNLENPNNTFYCQTHRNVHHLVYFEDTEIVAKVNAWL